MPLLLQEIAPVDRRQAELTGDCLTECGAAMMAYFLALRAETDAVLAPRLPPAAGKPYPYGRCEEITRDLFARLAQRLARPAGPVEQALHGFVARGGQIRTVWGVLRDQYFQNAIQVGGLYVDVSNDTVVVTKPKVEILPIEQSGLVCVRDIAHFRNAAGLYWGATLYANHLVPALAPLLPIDLGQPGPPAAGAAIGLRLHDRPDVPRRVPAGRGLAPRRAGPTAGGGGGAGGDPAGRPAPAGRFRPGGSGGRLPAGPRRRLRDGRGLAERQGAGLCPPDAGTGRGIEPPRRHFSLRHFSRDKPKPVWPAFGVFMIRCQAPGAYLMVRTCGFAPNPGVAAATPAFGT